MLQAITKAKESEARATFLQSAYIGWQVQETVKGALGGKGVKGQSFKDYAQQLGLLEPEPNKQRRSTKQEAAAAIADAIRIREAIRQHDEGRAQHGSNSL